VSRRYFDCCKTLYKPYDLAVQTCLVIAAHCLGEAIAVSSDGSMNEWQEAITRSARVQREVPTKLELPENGLNIGVIAMN
jgi:hypothetical protein